MPKYVGDLKLYTLPEVSERLGLGIQALRRYIRNGELAARKWGRSYYVSEDELEAYFQRTEEDQRTLRALKRRIETADAETIARVWKVLEDAENGSKSGNSRNRT